MGALLGGDFCVTCVRFFGFLRIVCLENFYSGCEYLRLEPVDYFTAVVNDDYDEDIMKIALVKPKDVPGKSW